MNTPTIIIALIIVVVIIGAIYFYWPTSPSEQKIEKPMIQEPNTPTTQPKKVSATIETSLGNMVVEFYDNDAPKTVANFVKLANDKFYDGLSFHRVISGFMIQGGDPNCTPARSSGPCGAGGPGYQFADELNSNTPSYQAGYKRGVMAMANAGPNTNGSQFFIMHKDYPLPNNYTIFGKVVSGLDVVDAIASSQTDSQDRPKSPVVINRVIIN